MSLVYITHHDENIFDVDKEKDYLTREKLQYTSKFHKAVKDEKLAKHIVELEDGKKIITSASRNSHQTMGWAQTPLELPGNFLKKNNGIKWQRLNEHKCPPKKEKEPIPHFCRPATHICAKGGKKDTDKKEEEDLCTHNRYLKSHKNRANFIAINVELAKVLKSKKPQPRYVDTPKGDRHNLLNSGLMPHYIRSENFAKVPRYLNARKKFLAKLHDKCEKECLRKDNALEHTDRYIGMKKLTAEERQNILKGLKTNLTKLFKTYQGLPLFTDTISKKIHKSKMENDLRQLEQDIHLIEHNQEIYVSEY